MPPGNLFAQPSLSVDEESRAWLQGLSASGPEREEWVRALHALLLKAARFEMARRRGALNRLSGIDQEDLAHQCADDALLSVLAKLSDFRGESRFTTWAYKFALYEAAVKIRRLAWREREIPLERDIWSAIADQRADPHQSAEAAELLAAVRRAIEQQLSPHQREVLVALVLGEVPIDVLAERLNSTRGALYKTLHDARLKLRAALSADGLKIQSQQPMGDSR